MTTLKLFPNPIRDEKVKDRGVCLGLEKKMEQESNMKKMNVESTSCEKKDAKQYFNKLLCFCQKLMYILTQ